MDEQSKPGPGAEQASTPGAETGPRDLSFLWPLIDRIRAVEIKFHPDGAPSDTRDLDARLKALEDAVAAIARMLQAPVAQPQDGGGDAAPAVPPPELPEQTWTRTAAGMGAAVLLLLLAHYVVVFALDLPTVVLRLVSIAIPLPVALWTTLRWRIRPWREVLAAVAVGVIAVAGMSWVAGLHEHTTVLPDNGREWRETIEYAASIAFAYLTGVLLSGALQVRSGAHGRAGQATLRLARAIASVTGKAIEKGPQIKKHVDLIHGIINIAILLTSALMAVITGLRSVIR